jgi:hypothetical protein
MYDRNSRKILKQIKEEEDDSYNDLDFILEKAHKNSLVAAERAMLMRNEIEK